MLGCLLKLYFELNIMTSIVFLIKSQKLNHSLHCITNILSFKDVLFPVVDVKSKGFVGSSVNPAAYVNDHYGSSVDVESKDVLVS